MPLPTQPIVWPGRPYPLGSTWDGEGVNFALYSERAEKVELCLFDISGKRETPASQPPRANRHGLAWLSARSASRAALRVPSLWALCTRARRIALITTNYCWIPTGSRFREPSVGATRTSDTKSEANRRICRLIGATMPPACRKTGDRFRFYLGIRRSASNPLA